MRHRERRSSFTRRPSHRKATLKNLVRALIKFQRITTTARKAKEARRLAEKLITIGRHDNLFARRRAYAILTDRVTVLKLFKDVVPLFKERSSGFTRIIPSGFRRGDGASMVILELTEKVHIEKAPKKKKKREEKNESEHPKEEAKTLTKEPAPPTHGTKSKPTLEEEKASQKAKTEDKRIDGIRKKGFLQNLRGRFRKRGTDT